MLTGRHVGRNACEVSPSRQDLAGCGILEAGQHAQDRADL